MMRNFFITCLPNRRLIVDFGFEDGVLILLMNQGGAVESRQPYTISTTCSAG